MRVIWLISIAVLHSICLQGENGSYTVEMKKLKNNRDELNYNRDEAPPNPPIILQIYFAIYHVEEVNETEEIITVHGTLFMMWYDQRLTWDPENYGGIRLLGIPYYPRKLPWFPQLRFADRARRDWSSELHWWQARFFLHEDGQVFVYIPFGARVTCNFEYYSKFPYDQQRCPLIIFSGINTMDNLRYGEIGNYSNFGFFLSPNHHFKKTFRLSPQRRTGTWIVIGGNLSYFYYSQGIVNRTEALTNPGLSYQFVGLWIRLQRHIPYFGCKISGKAHPFHMLQTEFLVVSGVSVVLPVVLVNLLTTVCAVVPWKGLAVRLLLFILLLMFLFSSNLMHSLPPATGPAPNIVVYYGLSLTQTAAILGIRLFLIWSEGFKSPSEVEITTEAGIFGSQDKSALIRYASCFICGIVFIVQSFLLL